MSTLHCIVQNTNHMLPGVLSDHADGMHASPTIYSDLNIPQLETLSPEQPHRIVDLALVEADSQGLVVHYVLKVLVLNWAARLRENIYYSPIYDIWIRRWTLSGTWPPKLPLPANSAAGRRQSETRTGRSVLNSTSDLTKLTFVTRYGRKREKLVGECPYRRR